MRKFQDKEPISQNGLIGAYNDYVNECVSLFSNQIPKELFARNPILKEFKTFDQAIIAIKLEVDKQLFTSEELTAKSVRFACQSFSEWLFDNCTIPAFENVLHYMAD